MIRVSNFQTGIGTSADVTLDMEQFISCIRVSLVDNISYLQDPEGGVISVSEVHELLANIHDILDNSVSKRVGNTALILVHDIHMFNSAARHCHAVWASQSEGHDSS